MTNAPIVVSNGGEAGYEQLKAERTMNPLDLHALPTTHPSNPAHHGNRHRRDFTGLHPVRHHPQNSLSKSLSLRQSRRNAFKLYWSSPSVIPLEYVFTS